jgi:hypothetical protein
MGGKYCDKIGICDIVAMLEQHGIDEMTMEKGDYVIMFFKKEQKEEENN